MQRQSSTKSDCRNASEALLVQDHAYEMRNGGPPPPPLSSPSLRRAAPAAVANGEMGSRAQPRLPQKPSMHSSSPLSSPTIVVKRTVNDGRSPALSALANHGGANGGGEEQGKEEDQSSCNSVPALWTSHGGATGAVAFTATTCAALIIAATPSLSSSAPSPAPPLSQSHISSISSPHNVRSASQGSGSCQVTSMFKNLLVYPPQVLSAASQHPPSTTMLTAAPEALVAPVPPARLTVTVESPDHTVTPRLSSTAVPIVVAAASFISPECATLSNQLTCSTVGESRRRNSSSAPTSAFQVDDDKAENSVMEGGAGGAGERWPVDPHHRTAPARNTHVSARLEQQNAGTNANATVADSVDGETTWSLRNVDHASEGNGTIYHAHLAASTRSSLAQPSSYSRPARSPACSPSSAAGAASAAPTPISNSVPAAPQSIRNSRNASNLNLAINHVRKSLFIGPPPSPVLSPVATSVASGGAGGPTSLANRGGTALSWHDLQSSSPSLRFGTHDPYNRAAIVATPLRSGVPRTTSFTSHHPPSATAMAPTGSVITRMQMWSASVRANGCAGSASAEDSGATLPYCAVANSDTMSMKSSTADVARRAHDGIMIWAAGGNPSKVPSPPIGEHPLYDPQCDYPFQPHETKRQQVQHASSYEPLYEQQQPEHHQGPGQQLPPHQQNGPQWGEQYQQQTHPQVVQEAPGHYQAFKVLPQHYEQAYPSECQHPRSEQQQRQQQQHQREACDYALQHSNPPQRQEQRYPCPQAPEPHDPYAYQTYPELPQHPLHSVEQQQQYPAQQASNSYASELHQRPQQQHRTQRPYGGRGCNAGSVHHNWNEPRKRTAQDVLPGFFSVDTIQLGDQTHLASDRNGVLHQHNEQQQQQQQRLGNEAPHVAALLASGSSLNNAPWQYPTHHQSCGPAAAPELDSRRSSPAPRTLPYPSVVRQQLQPQLDRSFSAHCDATPARGVQGDYYYSSRAGAESTAATSVTPPYGSDDDEGMRMHGGAVYGLQSWNAERHGGSASAMTVGGMMVAQPPHMAAPVSSRTPNPRACDTRSHRGGSSGGGSTSLNSGTGSGCSVPSNKSILSNNNLGSGMASLKTNENGSSGNANGGGSTGGMVHVCNEDNSADVCSDSGAPAPTLSGAGPNAPISRCYGGGDIRVNAATATAMYGGHTHYPSKNNCAVGTIDVYASQPERRTTDSAAATSPSPEGANGSGSTSSVPFTTPLPRSAGAMNGGAAANHQSSHGSVGSLQVPLNMRPHQQRHPNMGSRAATRWLPRNGSEDYSPHIASPNRRRFSTPSVNQPNQYGNTHCSQKQQKSQALSQEQR
ncbi:hypothetical protein LPMP_131280 [Leishmania panamensis]|uniref:Uncharacterized protein n=1 Tax=Leishmania panamensis TaxID=5679 RepID=A0A088RL55_LEIPA|nr:hypothetical protein LPMP_131280 [Leishmania panamensis]AIN96555.1 hypothetical protein LPMP_131280 [Leishmania panamensis]